MFWQNKEKELGKTEALNKDNSKQRKPSYEKKTDKDIKSINFYGSDGKVVVTKLDGKKLKPGAVVFNGKEAQIKIEDGKMVITIDINEDVDKHQFETMRLCGVIRGGYLFP